MAKCRSTAVRGHLLQRRAQLHRLVELSIITPTNLARAKLYEAEGRQTPADGVAKLKALLQFVAVMTGWWYASANLALFGGSLLTVLALIWTVRSARCYRRDLRRLQSLPQTVVLVSSTPT